MKIYIISGKAETGKNEIAKIITDLYKTKKVVTLAYASPIKEYAKNILNWDGKNPKPRTFLQQIGTIAKELNDENIFIRRMIEDIKIYQKYVDVIIISDARLIKEIEEIKINFKNVTTIHIQEKENNLTKEEQQHITETALDNYHNYDYDINNQGSIEQLKIKVKKIIEEVDPNE